MYADQNSQQVPKFKIAFKIKVPKKETNDQSEHKMLLNIIC